MREKCAFLAVVCLLIGQTSIFADEQLANKKETAAGIPLVKSAQLLLYDNRIYTRVAVNGDEEMNFGVDNGWYHTTLDARYMEGLNFREKNSITYSAMNKKKLSAELGSVPFIRVGELEIESPVVRKSDIFRNLSKNLKRKIHGILGYSSMKQFLTTFDFRNRRILFSSHSPEAVASLRAQKDVVALPFGPYLLSERNAHVFSVRININGKPVDAFIDLGFPGCILTSVNHHELGIHVNFNGKKTPLKILGFTGLANVTRAREISIGNYHCRNTKVIYLSKSDAPEITLIGVALIKRFTMTIDYKNRMVYLQKM